MNPKSIMLERYLEITWTISICGLCGVALYMLTICTIVDMFSCVLVREINSLKPFVGIKECLLFIHSFKLKAWGFLPLVYNCCYIHLSQAL